MKHRLLLPIILLGSAYFVSAQSQKFPWDDFRPRTLAEMVKQNTETQKESMKGVTSKEQMIIDADPAPSVVRMTYTGTVRPISESRRKYLKLWLESFKRDPQFNQFYDVEMLAGEGSTQYWLLVQKQLLPGFQQEIKAGEPVDLYVIRMGGFLVEKGWDWMFIVEEFRRPGTENADIFPWNDFERRTLSQLVKMNQEEDENELKTLFDKSQMVMRGKILPSVVRVTFTGESRAIGEERRKFIDLWASAYAANPNYGGFFETEFLFKEGSDEFWLPVARMIVPRFSKELKKGDAIDLYLIRPGGLRSKETVDWLFLAEEFQKPGTK